MFCTQRISARYLRIGTLLFLCALLVIPHGSVAQAEGTPSGGLIDGQWGGWIELTAVFFDQQDRVFGPGEVITVSGDIPYVPWRTVSAP